MGGTGWARFGRRDFTQSNCGVFRAGRWTSVRRTPLLSCNSSARRESQNPWMACFEPQYAVWRGIPRYARADPTWTMVPRSRGRIRARAARVPFTTPRYVTRVTRSKSSGSISQNRPNTDVMAPFTHTSMGPRSDSTRSAAVSTSPGSATSVGTDAAAPPAPSTSRTAPLRPSSPRARSPTAYPRSAKATAAARPTPADAPVTTTTRLPLTSRHPIALGVRSLQLQPGPRTGGVRAEEPFLGVQGSLEQDALDPVVVVEVLQVPEVLNRARRVDVQR